MKTILAVFLLFVGSLGRLVLQNEPFYNFDNNPCAGVPDLSAFGLNFFANGGKVIDGQYVVTSILTGQLVALSQDENGVTKCNAYVSLPPNEVANTFNLGFDFTPDGDLFVSNSGGTLWEVPGDNLSAPELAYRFPPGFYLPSGVSFVWRDNNAYVSSEFDGGIYNYDRETKEMSVAAHPSMPGYELLLPLADGLSINSSTAIGPGFGPAALTFDNTGKNAYVLLADRGMLVRMEKNDDGTLGVPEVLAHVPDYLLEGIYLDNAKKVVYFGAPFYHGINLTPDGPNGQYNGGMLPGNTLFAYHLKTQQLEQLIDPSLGSISGVYSAAGVIPGGNSKLLLTSSGLSDFLWPLGGVRNGNFEFPSEGQQIPPQKPFPGLPYNCKIHVVEISKDN